MKKIKHGLENDRGLKYLAKKKFGQKNFWLKKNFDQKIFGSEKIFW